MWKIHLTVSSSLSLLLVLVQAEYTIIPSKEVASYHYPAPPKTQQLYAPAAVHQSAYAAPQAYQNQYQGTYHTPASITKQFAAPALDNAAFNLALKNQGYTYGGSTPAFGAALRARSSKTTNRKPVQSAAPAIGSLNVKLPLPIGVTPLNIAPLPLQPGTPYARIPQAVTSYGTAYPQRKRR